MIDWLIDRDAVWVGLFVTVLLVTIFALLGKSCTDCRERGGVLVQGVFGPACVDRAPVKEGE